MAIIKACPHKIRCGVSLVPNYIVDKPIIQFLHNSTNSINTLHTANYPISEGHLSKTYGLEVNWSEIVYAVGTLEAFNMTDGFDITSSNSHDTFFILGGARPEMMMYVAYGNQGELFYNVNNTGTAVFSKSSLLGIGASMETNHWGPVPFVIAYALEKTPNYPDGNPAPKDCVFAFGGTGGRFVSFDQNVISEDEFHLDITW